MKKFAKKILVAVMVLGILSFGVDLQRVENATEAPPLPLLKKYLNDSF